MCQRQVKVVNLRQSGRRPVDRRLDAKPLGQACAATADGARIEGGEPSTADENI